MNLRDHIEHVVWPGQGAMAAFERAALRPLSSAFGFAVAMRNFAYDVGLFASRRAAVPVISVGNLAVGGTGKTPITLWLSRTLSARGMRAAIVMRGYGGTATGVTVVSRGQGAVVGATEAGDEAVMLAKCSDAIVVTAARRVEGAASAVALGAQVIVLDDGFQHRALARDFDLVLVDGRRGPLLPAGPLREGTRALMRADAVIAIADEDAPLTIPAPPGVPVHRARFEAAALIESVGGRWVTHPLGTLVGKRVIAVTGIARPERFYQTLHQFDADIVDVYAFDDHHVYVSSDWQTVSRRGQEVDLILTTEKDLVKLEQFPFESGKLMALRIAPVVDDADVLIASVLATVSRPA